MRIGVDLAVVDAAAARPIDAALRIIDEAGARVPPERGDLVAEAEFGVFFAYASSAGSDEFYHRRLPRLRKLATGDARLSALAGVVDAWTRIRRAGDRDGCVRRARSALDAVGRQRAWEFGLRLLAVGALINADAYDLADDTFLSGGGGPAADDSAIATYLHGRVLFGRGDLKSARTELGAALEDPFVARTVGFARLVRVLTEMGELDDAARLLREHRPAAPSVPTWTATAFAFAEGSLHAAHGRHGKALERYLEAGRGARAVGLDNPAVFPWRSQAARSHAALGDAAAGAARRRRAGPRPPLGCAARAEHRPRRVRPGQRGRGGRTRGGRRARPAGGEPPPRDGPGRPRVDPAAPRPRRRSPRAPPGGVRAGPDDPREAGRPTGGTLPAPRRRPAGPEPAHRRRGPHRAGARRRRTRRRAAPPTAGSPRRWCSPSAPSSST
ncbi:hypothetical protein BJF79_08250 [Actinomadura sp. CNU-125]|nr:hypothetical protein BJF79_08250 [Actinomadura sp. CNU-125]